MNPINDTPPIKRQRGRFAALMGRLCLRMVGWKAAGDPPHKNKFIIVAAPHTSNWDLVLTLACTATFHLKISWLGKHTIFKAPFAGLMKRLGGIPVNRDNPHGVVRQMIDLFINSEYLILTISPSGTRKKRDHWKSGFYRIANEARIPLSLGYLDYANRIAGFGPSFIPTGNVKADMDIIRKFYAGIIGKYPEKAADIRLQDEDNLTRQD
jgi:1-acyl-sn-glycerol-3-phosphate acyltransferase